MPTPATVATVPAAATFATQAVLMPERVDDKKPEIVAAVLVAAALTAALHPA